MKWRLSLIWQSPFFVFWIGKYFNLSHLLFYLAKYRSEGGINVQGDLLNFTGSVLLKNLENRKESYYQYKNGEQLKSSKIQENLRTSGCVTIVNCSCGNWNCGGVYITSTNGEGVCDIPSWIPCF